MTNREFLQAIATAAVIEMTNYDLSIEEIKAHAAAEIEKIDRQATRAKSQAKARASQENEPIKELIRSYLVDNNEGGTASTIAAAIGVTTQKASALCRQLAADGLIDVQDIKIKGRVTKHYKALSKA